MRPIIALIAVSLCLAACSSSSGGGGSQPASNTVVLPAGTHVVCSDGTAPPCN